MKSVKIGEMTLEVPIIQGGMGVGISLGNLAGNVALNGGMGVISTAQPGYRAADFEKNTVEANRRELASEIQKAKEIAKGKGIVAINAMVALTDYAGMVEVAVKNKIDAIISGAGLPLNLPGLVKDTKIKLAPIVSSGKAAKLICKTWDRKFKVAPDFIVIEGSEAGGHLGFHKEDVLNKTTAKLADIFKEVKETIQPFVEKYQKEIPVFVAGGIYDSKDINYNLKDLIKEQLETQNDFVNLSLEKIKENQQEIDNIANTYMKNWSIDRLSKVDKAILSLGIYELLKTDTPSIVAINEAVELAKKYSDEKVVKMINGVLDKIMHSENIND